jgi:hypothetical protein
MENNENKKTGIVLNRMYTGSYLSTNLGHEVINMFQADNVNNELGRHYLYLNAKGNYAKKHDEQISDMLLVRYAGNNKVQVLGWAKGLEAVSGAVDAYQGYDENCNIFKKQREYITKNNIKYGGVGLIELFKGSNQQNIYITYSAKEFYRPQKSIYIQYVNESDLLYKDDNVSITNVEKQLNLKLSGYQFGKATLKQYIYPNEHKNGLFKFDRRKKSDEYKQNFNASQVHSEEQFISNLDSTYLINVFCCYIFSFSSWNLNHSTIIILVIVTTSICYFLVTGYHRLDICCVQYGAISICCATWHKTVYWVYAHSDKWIVKSDII